MAGSPFAINNRPAESMRSLSVVVDAPSAVVWNVSRPGISFEPGDPSIDAFISATFELLSVPSAPLKSIIPTSSLFCNTAKLPIVADLLFDNISEAGLVLFENLDAAIPELPPSVPNIAYL